MAEREGEEARFRLLADHAPVMIWRADATGGYDFFNRPWLEFRGRTMEQELGLGWTEGLHPQDQAEALRSYREAFAARREFRRQYRLRRHDGAWRWVLDIGRPFEPEGRLAGYFGSCTDVTEMRQAVEERETLVSELHHRVKNNAQATSSFLTLQANRASLPEVAQALRGAASRVMLATLVQDRMFHVRIGAWVDLGAELLASARATLQAVGRPGIVLEEEVEPGLVGPVGLATTLGLMMNELVANAAQHAFPGGRRGRIRLHVAREDAATGLLVLEDDGVGFDRKPPRATPQGCLG
ncbi:MAG TPA: PAS domain S-box protein, partial [Crenalkalicoccus sp.]|nr:PAS domain S-box protein [Crenalkalicoccus sp.]